MEPRITIITLGVQDLQASTAFYEEHFGWRKSSSSNDSITFFRLNNITLGLYSLEGLAEDAGVPAERSGSPGFTLAHNVRSEKEVDILINKLKKKGVHIQKEPQKVFWGGYSSYVTDPDGYLWEIAYNPYMEV